MQTHLGWIPFKVDLASLMKTLSTRHWKDKKKKKKDAIYGQYNKNGDNLLMDSYPDNLYWRNRYRALPKRKCWPVLCFLINGLFPILKLCPYFSSSLGRAGRDRSHFSIMFDFTFVPTWHTATFATPDSKDETLFLLLCWAVQFISLATDLKSLFLPLSLFFLFMGTVWWAPTKRCVCFFPLCLVSVSVCAGTHSLT